MADPPAGQVRTADPLPRRPFSIGGPIGRAEWLVLAGVVIVYLLLVAAAVRRGPPLGWDESVYALRARDFADGVAPIRYWNDFRAPGLPWVGQWLLVAGEEGPMLRLLVAAFGLGMVGTTWLLARHLFGRRPGLIAAAGVAVTPPLLLAATQVWPDVPGAAVGLLAVALFVFSTGGERSSWWMLLVVPAVAAAVYLRFGAPLPIMIGLATVGVWRRRALWRRPGPAVVTAAASTAVVVLILEVPALTGSGSSPLVAIGGISEGWFEGLVDFYHLGGEVVGSAAVVLALLGLVVAGATAGSEDIDRGAFFAATFVGLATAVGVAVVLHGEIRYLAPAYPWLWIAGSAGLERVGGVVPRPARPIAAVVLLIALMFAGLGAIHGRDRESNRGFSALQEAAVTLAEEAGGGSCRVLTRRVPQVMWYSGCDAVNFDTEQVRLPRLAEGELFILFFEGDPWEPAGPVREGYLSAGDLLFEVEGYRDVAVYRVETAGAG